MAPETILRGAAVMLALPFLMAAQGLPAEWEVRDLALELSRQMDELTPAIQRFDTDNWSGAAAAYSEQRTAAANEAGYAAAAARQLAERPTSLGKAFELHLRIQAMEGLVASLATGAHTYQNDAVTEATLNQMAEARAPHSRLRDYIMDLATSKDQELAAIDAEAQRCRAEMLRAPVVPSVRRTDTAPADTRTNARKAAK